VPPGLYVVTVPFADVRAVPDHPVQSYAHDPHQETQLLLFERVRVIKTQGAWALIEAVEQPEYTHHQRWEGYPGWVLRSAIQPVSPRDAAPASATTHLPLPQQRQAIVRAAEAFIGTPYLWGGRSPATAGAATTGVDCSGLVNLAYRSVGMQIPRDAHEQWMRATNIERPEPADLIFLSEKNHPAKIVHVMLDAGDGWLIEAPGTGLTVRRIEAAKRLGRPLRELKSGDVIDGQTMSFGSYLAP